MIRRYGRLDAPDAARRSPPNQPAGGVTVGGTPSCVARVALLAVGLGAVFATPAAGAGPAPGPTYAVTPITREAGIDSASFNSLGHIALTIFQGSCCDDAGYWSSGVTRLLPLAQAWP